MLTFNVIDVETANADRASICQIGIVRVREGKIEEWEEWKTLVNPKCSFHSMNVRVHGILEGDVQDSPTLPAIIKELRARLHGSVLVSHSSFDRGAIERALQRYELEQLQVNWLDSVKIAQRAWPERKGRGGYGLKNLAEELGISFAHHDALEDARATAEIVLRACAADKTDSDYWRKQFVTPAVYSSSGASKPAMRRDYAKNRGNILFTGKLGISRREAVELAANAGFGVVDLVCDRVTMLVIGNRGRVRSDGNVKSRKLRMVEELIEQGADIQILSETDFFEVVGISSDGGQLERTVRR